MVQYIKMCVIRGERVCNQKCVRRPIITHTIASNKTYVICFAYTTSIGHLGMGGHPDEGVCDIWHAVHSDELFALRHENRNGST